MSVSPNGSLVSVGWDDSIAFTSFPGSLGTFIFYRTRILIYLRFNLTASFSLL